MNIVIEIRLEYIKYGSHSLLMGIDKQERLYMTFPSIESLFEYGKDSFRKKLKSKALKSLLGERLITGKHKAKITNKDIIGTPNVNVIDFDLFLAIAQIEGRTNDNVFRLLVDGFGDSLRSLALEQFGVAVEVEKRQIWLEDRLASKDAFKQLNDSIKTYIDNHPERSKGFRDFAYSNCQNAINRRLFGKDARTVREELGNVSHLLRDHYNQRALRRIEAIQSLANRYIVKSDMEPLEAVKKALDEYSYGVIGYND